MWTQSLRPPFLPDRFQVWLLAIVLVPATRGARAQSASADVHAPARATAVAPNALSETLVGSARSAYDAGKLLARNSDYAGALVKFREAYELSKEPRLHWNIAACEKQLRHYAKVRESLSLYLSEGDRLLTDGERAEARNIIAALDPFVTTVALIVSEAGAIVEVDGVSYGVTPLAAPLLVDMGTRSLKITKPGFIAHSQVFQARGGDRATIGVRLDPEPHEGTLRIAADPPASVSIDGRVVGTSPWEGKLPSGRHHVAIRLSGRRPYDGEVEIRDNQTNSFSLTLQEERGALFGIPAWGWVAGGVALAGLGVGGYFLLRPKEAERPPTVSGTLGEFPLPLHGR